MGTYCATTLNCVIPADVMERSGDHHAGSIKPATTPMWGLKRGASIGPQAANAKVCAGGCSRAKGNPWQINAAPSGGGA